MSHLTEQLDQLDKQKNRYEKLRLALTAVTTIAVLILLAITLLVLDDIQSLVQQSNQDRAESTERIGKILDEVDRRSQEQHDRLGQDLTRQHKDVEKFHQKLLDGERPIAP